MITMKIHARCGDKNTIKEINPRNLSEMLYLIARHVVETDADRVMVTADTPTEPREVMFSVNHEWIDRARRSGLYIFSLTNIKKEGELIELYNWFDQQKRRAGLHDPL